MAIPTGSTCLVRLISGSANSRTCLSATSISPGKARHGLLDICVPIPKKLVNLPCVQHNYQGYIPPLTNHQGDITQDVFTQDVLSIFSAINSAFLEG